MNKTAILSVLMGFACGPLLADEVFRSDVIVDGAACIGRQCEPGIDFEGNDQTFKLFNQTVRLWLEDSSTGTFPQSDWAIAVNDAADLGAEWFGIFDCTSTGGMPYFGTCERRVFKVDLGADDNSLVVASEGLVIASGGLCVGTSCFFGSLAKIPVGCISTALGSYFFDTDEDAFCYCTGNSEWESSGGSAPCGNNNYLLDGLGDELTDSTGNKLIATL